MKHRHTTLLLWLCLTLATSGCGLLFPSHHRTEDYKPVFAAASAGDLAALRQAVDADPSLVKATEWGKATLLHDAVQHDQLEAAAYLLSQGADVNALTDDRLTPLHMAAQNGDVPDIELLLAHHATINPVDAKGWTPLDRAVKWHHAEAADILEQHGGHAGTATP